MTPIIRNIQKADKHGIKEFIDAVNHTDQLDYSITDEWFDYVIAAAGEGIFVVFCNGKIIGLAACMINTTDNSQASVNIVIHPDYRNQGLGSKLYNKVVKYTKARGIKLLESVVKKSLDISVHFAEKRGFYPVLYAWQMELELDKYKIELINQNMSVCFREATLKDSSAYSEIISKTFGDKLDDNALGELLKDNSIMVYVLESLGRAVGLAAVQFRTNVSVGYIYDVAVLKEYRRRGLGTYIMKNCINEIKNGNLSKASLLVTGENETVLALYQRLNFMETDIDLIMQKNLL
jgi:ribosomal protein S18 acetylase RimI-like enzyme